MNISYTVGDSDKNVSKNRERFFKNVGILQGQLALPKQCHSARVVCVETGGQYESCDGLVSNTPGVWLGISVADCTPIVLADPKRKAAAVLHAGWRGTMQGIVGKGVELMIDSVDTNPADLIAFIGPSSGVCCYEIGEDVASKFSSGVLERRNGSIFLDLKKENRLQLNAVGVVNDNIEISPYCTICTPGLFHSFRRDRDKSGRMMAAVGLLS
jgi:YfiH family protein